MSHSNDIPPIQLSYTVPVSEQRAFDAFVLDFAAWWPREYTWAGDVLQTIGIEPHQGGACYEIDTNGNRREWGRVLAYEAPRRIVFTWQIGMDRQPISDLHNASEIEFRCTHLDPNTARVEFEHRHFARHGAEAAAYREAMASSEGWPLILDRYIESLKQ